MVLDKTIYEWKWGVTKQGLMDSFPMFGISNCHVTICSVVHHQEWIPQALKCSTITFTAASRQASNIQLGLNCKLSGCDHQHSSLALAVAMLCQHCCCCCCCLAAVISCVLNNKKISSTCYALHITHLVPGTWLPGIIPHGSLRGTWYQYLVPGKQ